MNSIPVRWTAAILMLCAPAAPAHALDLSVAGIHGDLSRALLGDGTGVVIGYVDSGVDDLHPALAGTDSLGNPRLVSERNFVTTESSTGDDVFGHGTWVSSIALSRDPTYTGFAPDARYVNARVLTNTGLFLTEGAVRNGIGYAIGQGADIVNLSLNFFAPTNNGFSQLDLMIDWAAYERGIITTAAVGNISGGTGTSSVRGPGSAFNGITVGRTLRDYSKASIDSAGSYTADGRMKPDVVAPGTLLTLANDDWETPGQPQWETNHNGILLSGTSFATGHATGMVAQQLEAGRSRSWSTDPLVVKATLLNSASKNVLDRDFNPWEQTSVSFPSGVYTTAHPLDTHTGAGQIDGLALANQYLAGEMGPGLVGDVGWDLHAIGHGEAIDYTIDPNLLLGTSLTATLAWHRHVGRTDNGNGIVDQFDTFTQLMPLNNLNLQILRNGVPVAQSTSAVDNVEHLYISIDAVAQYTLRVLGVNVAGGAEPFALAWHGVPVPEPATIVLALLAASTMAGCRRRRGGL